MRHWRLSRTAAIVSRAAAKLARPADSSRLTLARRLTILAAGSAAIPENGSDQPFAKPRSGTIKGWNTRLAGDHPAEGGFPLRAHPVKTVADGLPLSSQELQLRAL